MRSRSFFCAPAIKSLGLCAALALAQSILGAPGALASGERHATARPSGGTVLVLKAAGEIVPSGALVHVVATGYSFKSKVTIEGTGKKAAVEQAVECETEYFEQGHIQRNFAANSWQVTETQGLDFCEGEEWFAGHGMSHPLQLTAPNIVTDESSVELFRTEEQIKAEEKSEFEHEEPLHPRDPKRCTYNTIGARGHFKSVKGGPLVAKLKGKMVPSPGQSPGCGSKARWRGMFTLTYKGQPIVAALEVGPSVSSVSPAAGPDAGGTEVTLSGSGFTGATAVQFGTINATSVKVNSSGSITAVAPKGSGTVDVTVMTPVGQSAISPADQFTY